MSVDFCSGKLFSLYDLGSKLYWFQLNRDWGIDICILVYKLLANKYKFRLNGLSSIASRFSLIFNQ